MTRDEYVKDLTTKIEKFNSGIDKIERKAESMKENAKKKFQTRIQDLHAKKDDALLKINAIKEAGEDSWQDLREGAEKLVHSIQDTMSNVQSHFKKKKVE